MTDNPKKNLLCATLWLRVFLMQEMYMTADDDYCFIEADLSEIGGNHRW